MSNSSFTPAPSAVMMLRISSLARILSMRAFSTFRILPRMGRMAWKRRSRPCFADPPAESPSTMYSSHSSGLSQAQSASLPGSEPPSRMVLRRARSRDVRAALDGVDVVDERQQRLAVGIVVLERHLHRDVVPLAREHDRLRVQRLLVRVQELHELGDAALGEVVGRLARARVEQVDGEP